MTKIQLELTIEETNLVLEALGQLPFARVYTLIGRIQEEARVQLVRQGSGAGGVDADRQDA